MQNIDEHNTEINSSLRQLLTELRQEECRGQVYVMAARFEILALEIKRRRLSCTDAAELLINTAEILLNEAREIH